jgi:hypothetical protein
MIDLDILTALRARAAQILTANGYHTNAGAQIYQGRVFDLETDPVPAIVITQPEDDADLVEDDEISTAPRWISTFVLEAYAAVSATDPLPDLMRLRADLLTACYRPEPDRTDTLGDTVAALVVVGTTKLMPAPGQTIGMAQLTLRAEYAEIIGD